MFQVSVNSNVLHIPPTFSAFHIPLIFARAVVIKNIKNMHALLTNQIADILHYNDN